MKIRDLVQTWVYAGTRYSTTGRIDEADLMFGKIVQAGPKSVTVLLENGSRNRLCRNHLKGATLVTQDMIKEVERIMKKVQPF